MFMMDLKTASPQEIAKYFSREVNNMFFKPDKIAEEQNGSRQMEDLDICWIKVISDSGDGNRPQDFAADFFRACVFPFSAVL